MFLLGEMDFPPILGNIPMTESPYQIKRYLKENGFRYSFPNKETLYHYILDLTRYYQIPWRKDQYEILQFFFQNKDWKEIIVQAIFGGGKTTMIIAILFHLLLTRQVQPSDIFICAFNCAIKNELIKKTKIVGKCNIRTFDSFIYLLCKELEYENLKQLNFETKRKFVFENLESILPNKDIKYVFIDESQDLEKNCYFILKKYFVNAKFLFVGDIFQSIQKEPRDSLLWFLLNHSVSNIHIFNMYDTPRVPRTILKELKTTLYQYYPEFQTSINHWTSSSLIKKQCYIKWKKFSNYKEIFQNILKKLKDWKHCETMILTFSSAITVRGSLGDVSRFRRFFNQHQIPINSNHKKMLDDRLFLTTANSSKGLERKNIIAVLTFPLEMAFANFSDDLVMNLITVALSRTKENIIFYVPNHCDRFSNVLNHFIKCPKPSTEISSPLNSSNKKMVQSNQETHSYTHNYENPVEILELEHSITEVLRQNILSFETREKLLSFCKIYDIKNIENCKILNHIQTEEECTLIGLLFESLILSLYLNRFSSFHLEEKKHHILFQNYFKLIDKDLKQYKKYIQQHPITNESIRLQGCYLYSKLHLLIYHKIQVELSVKTLEIVLQKWISLIPTIRMYQLNLSEDYHLESQQNVSMPFLNGIMDACGTPVDKSKPLIIYEIKASRSSEWQKLATLQSILYGILSAKDYFSIHLLNVLHSKFLSINVSLKKNLMNLRNLIFQDILTWNLNCFLSKNVKKENNWFLYPHISDYLFIEQDSDIICLCYVISPTKIRMDILDENISQTLSEKISIYQKSYNVQHICSFSSPSYPSIYKETNYINSLLSHYTPSKLDVTKCYNRMAIQMTGLVCQPQLFDFKSFKNISSNNNYLNTSSNQ